MYKEIDVLVMKIWNDKTLTNEIKYEIVKRLQEVQILLQEGDLCIGRDGRRLL